MTMAIDAWLLYWGRIRRGGDCGKVKGKEHAPTKRGISAQIQPKLAPCCHIFQFWREAGNLIFFLFLKKNYFIEVELVYNVVLISGVQQSDSVIHICTFFFIFFSVMVHHRILNIVPCAISRTLLFIHSLCNSLHLLIPNSQSTPLPPPLPLGNHKSVLYVCESVSVL